MAETISTEQLFGGSQTVSTKQLFAAETVSTEELFADKPKTVSTAQLVGDEFEKFGNRVVGAALTVPVGIAETGAHLATMTYGVPLTGIGEIIDLATDNKFGVAEKVSNALIYQPQTDGGELVRDILFAPALAASYIGEKRADTLHDELVGEYGADDIRTTLYPAIRKTIWDIAGIAVSAKGMHRPSTKAPKPKEYVETKPSQKAEVKPQETEAPAKIQGEAKEIVRERRANIDTATYETNKFVNELERTLTPKEREALPFAIEKTGVPEKLGRPDLEAVDLKTLDPVVKKVKAHFDKGWEKIKEHIPEMSEQQIQDYVTHIWDIPKNKSAEVTNWFVTQNKFLKKRYVSTLKEGIEKFDLKPKVLDIGEIIRIHDSITNRSIENVKYIKKLSSMKEGGVPLITRADKAPDGWVSYDHPAINKTLYLPSKAKGAPAKLIDVSAKVHPDLVKPLQVVLDGRWDHPVINAYEAINGILKKSNLSLSLFHHGALGETGVATMGLAKTANIYFNPVKIYKGLVKGEFDVFAKEPITRDAIQHGVQFGATADIPVAKIQQGLNNLARKTKDVPLANKATKFMATFNHKWDVALWDYLHDTLKLHAYEHLVSKIDLTKDAVKQKHEIAQMVNDTFGGQNWDTLMTRPKTIQIASWGLLSPDWTISTIRQALSPTGIGKIHRETVGLRQKMGTKFWLKAGLYFGAGINLLNIVNRRKDMIDNPQYYDGEASIKDLSMVGNTIGNKTRLFMGRYEDGSERYVRWGKQFREMPELLFDETGFSPVSATLKKVGGKAAPALQISAQVFTGASLSGFRNDDISGKKGWKKTYGIAKTVMLSPFPFSLKTILRDDKEFHATDIAMPSGKGMTRYKAVELFKTSIVSGDTDMLREVYADSLQNNLPAFTLFGAALSSIKAQATKDINEGLDTLSGAREKFKNTTNTSARIKIARKIDQLSKQELEKKQGLKLLNHAILKANHYGQELEKLNTAQQGE